MSPEEVIELFRRSGPADWISGSVDNDEAAYGHRQNVLVTLWPLGANKYELRYGYQAVALVSGIGGSIEPLVLEVRKVD